MDEVVQTASDLDYGKFSRDDFFAYLEVQPENQVMQLVRLEDSESLVAEAWETGKPLRLRVQQWSDSTADGSIDNGSFSSVKRLKVRNRRGWSG